MVEETKATEVETKPKKTKKSKKLRGNDRRNVWLLIATTILIIASIFCFTPPSEKINQGLDIQGGLSVVLTAKNTTGAEITSDDMESSRAIIENRVNALGASEATVQVQNDDQILVQIPGLSDTQTALTTIGKTGKLEFARLDSITDEEVATAIKNGNYGTEATVTDDFGNTFSLGTTVSLPIEEGTYTPLITGQNITSVSVGKASDTSQYYAVNIKLDSEGTSAFAQATSELVSTNGQIVIILDGIVQSAPAVQSAITGGEVQITGNYSLTEAQSLQTILQSGSLPLSFEYSQSQVVGPTLGQEALAAGVLVAIIGLILVMLYLLVFYKGLGMITAAAIGVFALFYLGILAFLSQLGLFSLSMAGIAGIVLTIGMAADSSVLTLERFREEIRQGKSIKAASNSGVHHAIVTSIDADSVTLVSALTLFFLASASVKGFGLTLALGVMCDIVMMLMFKAPLIRLLAPRAIAKNPKFWGIQDSIDAVPYYDGTEPRVKAYFEGKSDELPKIKGRFIKRDFNFLGYRKIFLTIAAVAMALCLVIFGVRGLSLGIEFVGGTSVTFHNTGDVTTEEMRTAFTLAGEPDAVIQTTTTDGEPGFLVRTTTMSATDASETANTVASTFGLTSDNYEVTTIGPDWGASVVRSSVIAFLVSLLLIIIYIAIRFEYKMGIVAVVALIHDLVLVVGIYALVGRELTPNTIAALLTILGYSLYDTVVVFHRINDNMQSPSAKCTFMTMANHSINQVLLRTINTTLTSLIPVLFMLLFGGETLKDFAFAMVIGLVAGSYSSIAIATPLYSMWKTRESRYAKLQRKYGTEIGIFEYDRLRPSFAAASVAGADVEVSDNSAEATAAQVATIPVANEATSQGGKQNKKQNANMKPSSGKRPNKPKASKGSKSATVSTNNERVTYGQSACVDRSSDENN